MSFGHAGTIVEGKEDSATEKIARLEAAGIPVVERIDEIPDAVKRTSGGRGMTERRATSDERLDGVFIDVEVADEVADDPELAREARGGLPGRHLRGRRRQVVIVGREPRRVRALRALPRGRAGGGGAWSRSSTTAPSCGAPEWTQSSLPRNDPWLRRIAAAALVLAAATASGAAWAKPDDTPKPKPKPKLELLTASQEEALLKGAVKVEVRSKRGDEVRVKAILVVDGFPDDFTFKLGPESKGLRDGRAKVKLGLSARKREVLACRRSGVRQGDARDRGPRRAHDRTPRGDPAFRELLVGSRCGRLLRP